MYEYLHHAVEPVSPEKNQSLANARGGSHLLHTQKLEALGLLSCGVTHEVRNLLTPIVINAELAQLCLDQNHPVQKLLMEIIEASARASQLVRQFVEFGGVREPRYQSIGVRQMIDDALRLLRAGIPGGIEIRTGIEPGLPAVFADIGELHQILTNLLINAWQAMETDAGLIEISATAVTVGPEVCSAPLNPPPGRHVRLSVRDNGRGMDEATLARLFEPFFTTKPAGQGTGIGLAIVRKIVSSYAGGITVETTPGRGTAFHIYLPVELAGSSPAGAGKEAGS